MLSFHEAVLESPLYSACLIKFPNVTQLSFRNGNCKSKIRTPNCESLNLFGPVKSYE